MLALRWLRVHNVLSQRFNIAELNEIKRQLLVAI
jgi:hypothetical protein